MSPMRGSLLACLCVSAAAGALEDTLKYVTDQISGQVNGGAFVLLEAYACHQDPAVNGRCLSQEPIADVSQAEYMHAVFVPSPDTVPMIEAQIDLRTSPPGLELRVHEHPWLQSHITAGFPPRSNVTFARAAQKLREAMPDTKILEASFRRPVHPCVSEDLFQFVLNPDTNAEGSVVSVGVETGNICLGFQTQKSVLDMCGDPVCFGSPVAV